MNTARSQLAALSLILTTFFSASPAAHAVPIGVGPGGNVTYGGFLTDAQGQIYYEVTQEHFFGNDFSAQLASDFSSLSVSVNIGARLEFPDGQLGTGPVAGVAEEFDYDLNFSGGRLIQDDGFNIYAFTTGAGSLTFASHVTHTPDARTVGVTANAMHFGNGFNDGNPLLQPVFHAESLLGDFAAFLIEDTQTGQFSFATWLQSTAILGDSGISVFSAGDLSFTGGVNLTPPPPTGPNTEIPEPGTVLLLGAGLAAVRRTRGRTRSQ